MNFVTTIESYDGGFAYVNGESVTQFPKGATQETKIKTLMGNLPNITPGAIGPSFINDSVTGQPVVGSRANSFSGSTMENLRQITNGGVFIDLGKVHALSNNEYLDTGTILTINKNSGLLGTPVLEESIVKFDMLFEPALNPGAAVNLQSVTEYNFNGLYRVTGVKHRGMISEAVCGEAITTGEFFFSKLLTPVKAAAS